jgi:predicted phage tail protein
VGARTVPPYQVNAVNLAPGYYLAHAQAFDDRGATGYSAAMEFRVAPPAGTPELRFRYQTLPGGRVLTLEWDDPMAILEHSPKLPGNWNPVPGASSPFPVEPAMQTEFFRLHLR